MSKNNVSKACVAAVALLPVVMSSPVAAKRQRVWDQTMACPSDAPVLIGSQGAASRFTALAGCADLRVVPEADVRQTAETDPGDYIVRETRRAEGGRLVEGYQTADLASAAPAPAAGDVKVTNDYTTTGTPVVTIAPLDKDAAGAASLPRAIPAPLPSPSAPFRPLGPTQVANVQPVALAVPAGDLGERLLDLRPARATKFDDEISAVARRQRVDPLLLHAVIKHESAYRPTVVSRAGAVGMMQVMPATGRTLGLPPAYLTHPRANVEAGARLLRKLADKYGSDFRLVLAAYNAGEGAVARYGNQVPPYAETQAYVRDVLGEYRRLAAENGLQLGQGN